MTSSLGQAVADKLRAAANERVEERVRLRDATLWGPPGTAEIANRLGWLTIAERVLAEVDDLRAFADGVRGEGMRDVVLLGMGGSSLAPEVLRRCFEPRPGHPRLQVLDSTDAAAVRAVGESVDVKRTLFLVSSKSGGTIEPLSLFSHFWSLHGRGENYAAITDPGSGLEQLAKAHGFRRVFHGDPEIGGRYSALSVFGMVPGALIGVDVAALLRAAPEAWQTPLRSAPGAAGQDGSGEASLPAAIWLGVALSALARAGRDKLTFVISGTLPGLGLWLEQLVAESTGKRETGILPVAEEPLGALGDYGEDRVFAYLPDVLQPDPQLDAHAQALAQDGHPVITLPTRGPGDLGRVFMLWELAVAVAGPTCSRPRTPPRGCWPTSSAGTSSRASPPQTPTRRRRGWPRPRHRATWRSWATCGPPRTSTRRSPSCAGRCAGPPRRRPRSATARASCTPPASSTRAGRRSVASCSCSTTSRRTSRSRERGTASRR